MVCHHHAMLQEHDNKQRTIRYSKEKLLSLEDTHCPNDLDNFSLILPSPFTKRKRGRKGGVRARTRRRGKKLHLNNNGRNGSFLRG